MDWNHPELSLRRQSELLGVNRSGLYYQPLGESEESLMLMRLIDEEYTRHPIYGSRRMKEWLCGQGNQVGRNRVRRLMRMMGIEAVYRKPRLSQPGEGHKIYPYLLKGVEVTRINQVWSTDITYIRMAEGFVYLVAVMDWYSRYVLSWGLSMTMELDFCVEALKRALRRGRPEIFNSGHLRFSAGLAVHQREVHRRVEGARHHNQHGRTRALFRQHFHRTAVALIEVRRGLFERIRSGAGGANGHRQLVQVLQPRQAASKPGLSNAGETLLEMTTRPQKRKEAFSDLGGQSPNPRGLTLSGRNDWSTMIALERRIGQRRGATRAPAQGPEWRGGSDRPRTNRPADPYVTLLKN